MHRGYYFTAGCFLDKTLHLNSQVRLTYTESDLTTYNSVKQIEKHVLFVYFASFWIANDWTGFGVKGFISFLFFICPSLLWSNQMMDQMKILSKQLHPIGDYYANELICIWLICIKTWLLSKYHIIEFINVINSIDGIRCSVVIQAIHK